MARVKYTLEFTTRAKPELIYTYISTASGLATWFADDVNVNGKMYTFIWDGAEEKAELVSKKINKMTRFKWLDREQDEYVSFEIVRDELTDDVSLMVTDFEEEDDVDDAKAVWEVSIDQLKMTIGG
ncbi:SRPBCC domain-containing protein [bacterium]|nr:SRPBCC domain-containing protein [bacterium]